MPRMPGSMREISPGEPPMEIGLVSARDSSKSISITKVIREGDCYGDLLTDVGVPRWSTVVSGASAISHYNVASASTLYVIHHVRRGSVDGVRRDRRDLSRQLARSDLRGLTHDTAVRSSVGQSIFLGL